jgi:hypothetical protein
MTWQAARLTLPIKYNYQDSMKQILSLIALTTCTAFTASAQDLAYKIPEKAFTVASIKGDQLLRLTSVDKFNNSTFGKKILEGLSKSTEKDLKSIEDLGFNLSANIYYYYQVTDSIDYTGILIPIADAGKVSNMLTRKEETVRQENGMNILERKDDKTVLAWNNQLLLLVSGRPKTYFFSDSAVAARYNIDYEYAEDQVEVAVDANTIDTAMVAEDYPETDTAEAEAEAEAEVVMETPAEVPVDAPPPPMLSDDYNEDYEGKDKYEEQARIKDSIGLVWLGSTARYLFDKKESTSSILNIPGFKRASDPAAVATFWMTDMQSIYSSFLPYTMIKYGQLMKGYGSMNARLYMDKEQMRLTSEIGLDQEKSTIYGKICDQQLNKKFLQYVNSDSIIGFMSYAYNTEAYMNELPRLLTGMYSKYDDEMMIAGEMISLLLDEKAVANVVKGDALFLLSGLNEKEVSYSSYTYDQETFEYKDTIKTKMETLPDFLCMFSSDDTGIIQRLLNYGIKKEKILLNNGIYSFEGTKTMPLNLHLQIKDGIVFLGTSITHMREIQNGTFKSNVSKEQKQLLTKNNFSFFFNPKNLGQAMPKTELGESTEKLRNLLGGAGNVYMTSAGIDNGYIGVSMIADVPKEKENALQYFLDMIEEMQQLK